MSKGREKPLSKGQLPQGNHSVYDFLYQDVRRVNSLLAQFGPEGHLQSIKRLDEVTGEESGKETQDGGVSAGIIKGKMSSEEAWTQGHSNVSERAYDPLWQNALALLSFLQNQSYLQRTLEKARIGQTILVSGELDVFDMNILISFFSDMKQFRSFSHLFDDDKKTPKAAQEKKVLHEKVEAIAKMLGRFPLQTQAVLRTVQSSIWCLMKSDSMEAKFTEIMLKYGSRVAGTWNMLAILDCFPDEPDSLRLKLSEGEVTTLQDACKRLDFVTKHIGRPPASYGVTPLLIFRSVELASE